MSVTQNQQSRGTCEKPEWPGAITEKLVKDLINKTSEVRETISLSNQFHQILPLHIQKPASFVQERWGNACTMPTPDWMHDSAVEVSTVHHCQGVPIKGVKSIGITCSPSRLRKAAVIHGGQIALLQLFTVGSNAVTRNVTLQGRRHHTAITVWVKAVLKCRAKAGYCKENMNHNYRQSSLNWKKKI